MNERIKKLWIEALRSGNYVQNKKFLGRNPTAVLRTPGPSTFSSLGVLCNLHALEHPEIASKEMKAESYLGYIEALPYEVAVWSEMDVLSDLYGYIPGTPLIDVKCNTLLCLELQGRSFETIATIIEQKFL